MKKPRGYYRSKKGTSFIYKNELQIIITPSSIKNWINSLVIPPAWTNVWISKDRSAYLLVTGYDDKSRKQYIYHPSWVELADRKKFKRLRKLGKTLPKIRKHLSKALTKDDLSKDRVLAAIVTIIDQTGVRVGNKTYTKNNGSYGITTLRKKHVSGKTKKAFEFVGKSGQDQEFAINDKAVVKLIAACEDVAGYELFKYIDDEGGKHVVTSDEVNDYIKDLAGTSLTAKDFRTWYGTVEALKKCLELGTCFKDIKSLNAKKVYKHAAKKLGNTPKIAEDSYVHPAIVKLHFANEIPEGVISKSKYLTSEEAILSKILDDCEKNF
jgi:DNA topoisomerase-1